MYITGPGPGPNWARARAWAKFASPGPGPGPANLAQARARAQFGPGPGPVMYIFMYVRIHMYIPISLDQLNTLTQHLLNQTQPPYSSPLLNTNSPKLNTLSSILFINYNTFFHAAAARPAAGQRPSGRRPPRKNLESRV